MKTDTETLVAAMRVLARDIQSEDGIANSAIAEAADRLEELHKALDDLNRVTNPLLIHSDREIHRARVVAQKALGME